MTSQCSQLLTDVAKMLDGSRDPQARSAARMIRHAVQLDTSTAAIDTVVRKAKSAATRTSRKQRKALAKALGVRTK